MSSKKGSKTPSKTLTDEQIKQGLEKRSWNFETGTYDLLTEYELKVKEMNKELLDLTKIQQSQFLDALEHNIKTLEKIKFDLERNPEILL